MNARTMHLAGLRASATVAVSHARSTGDQEAVNDALELVGAIRFAQALNRGTPVHLIDPFGGWDLTMTVDDRGYFATT